MGEIDSPPATASASPGSAGRTELAAYCTSGRENLCDRARFTGYHRDGGYAELVVADERYCAPIPPGYSDVDAAPLLCAGLIGYRALKLAGDGERLGLYGFGSSAHIVCQVARHQGRRVFAFTRAEDTEAQALALELGAEWAGDSLGPAPEELDAAIIFAPVGELVPAALRATAKGATVVCAGIHMTDIPTFPYELLWEERVRALGRQPHARGRRGVHGTRAGSARAHRRGGTSARGGQRGPRPPSRRPDPRGRGADHMTIDELYAAHPELRSAEQDAEHRVEGRRGILNLVEPGTVGAELGVFTGLFAEAILERSARPSSTSSIPGGSPTATSIPTGAPTRRAARCPPASRTRPP